MSTFYIDYVNGNDANAGTSWATAWKTINLGATAARIAPGDFIRLAKSPDPESVCDAIWTDLSKTVTLATAQNATVDNCENVYTAGTNVTCAATTATYKQGTKSLKVTTNASVTAAQKLAYLALASPTDFSAYQNLSFRVQFDDTAPADGLMTICLCSDTAGDTVVDTFSITGVSGLDRWMPLNIAKSGGGNLGSSIQSIAIYVTGSYASKDVFFDNFIACTSGGLNLQSLISKNTASEDMWYPIQSIVGTTVLIDNHVSCISTAGRGFSGASETVTLYKRETIKTPMGSSTSMAVTESGTETAFTDYSGGWNTTTDTQDGDSFFDGSNGLNWGFRLDAKSYITASNMSFTRFYCGASVDGVSFCTKLYFNHLVGNTYAYWHSDNNHNAYAEIKNGNNNEYQGLCISGFACNVTARITGNASNNMNEGLYLAGYAMYCTVYANIIRNNGSYGVYFQNNACGNRVWVESIYNNPNAIACASAAIGNMVNCPDISWTTTMVAKNWEANWDSFIDFQNGNEVSALHGRYFENGQVTSDLTTRHTASGMSWKVSPQSAFYMDFCPLRFPVAKIAVVATNQVTVKAWLYRDNAGITGKLACPGGRIAGVPSDVVATLSATGSWEEQTITFTPTEAGVVEIEVWAYGGTTYNVYVDDMTITQV